MNEWTFPRSLNVFFLQVQETRYLLSQLPYLSVSLPWLHLLKLLFTIQFSFIDNGKASQHALTELLSSHSATFPTVILLLSPEPQCKISRGTVQNSYGVSMSLILRNGINFVARIRFLPSKSNSKLTVSPWLLSYLKYISSSSPSGWQPLYQVYILVWPCVIQI